MIDYLFRQPRFPAICVIGDWLVTASSATLFEQRLAQANIAARTKYSIVDSTGEDWELHSGGMNVRPTMRRKWSKKKIVQTYNQSRNRAQIGESYSERSLSSKRFEAVFADIVTLIEKTLPEGSSI